MAPLGRPQPGLPAGGRRLPSGPPAAAAAGSEAGLRRPLRRRDRPARPPGLGPGAPAGHRRLGLPGGLLQRGAGLGRDPHDLRQAAVDLLVLGRVRQALPAGRALRGSQRSGADRRRPRAARVGARQSVEERAVAARCKRGRSRGLRRPAACAARLRRSSTRATRLRCPSAGSPGFRRSAPGWRTWLSSSCGLSPRLRRSTASRRLPELLKPMVASRSSRPRRLVRLALHKPTVACRSSPPLRAE